MECEEKDGDDEPDEITGISHLPQEVLEHIFGMVSPYSDFKSIMLTCSWWYKIVGIVAQRMNSSFLQSVKEGVIDWTPLETDNPRQTTGAGNGILERYSHCAAYLGCSLYVFGGCTSSNTTFNDLWRFDLATRQWIRPLAMGTYPSPKACATMVTYRETLILFGGYTHPTPYPLHQAARFFNQLHVYDPSYNRWSTVNTLGYSPPPIAGHSASVVGDRMIVFGGSHGQGSRTNDVWVLDLAEFTWSRRDIVGRQPNPRYGQAQVVLDNHYLLVIGGCGGANMLFSDIWMLDMSDEISWRWVQMTVKDADPSAALQLWCHPACKVGDVVVVLSKATTATPKPPSLKLSPVRAAVRFPRTQPTGDDSVHHLPFRPPALRASAVLSPGGPTDPLPSTNTGRLPPPGNRRTPPREIYTNRATPSLNAASTQRARAARFHESSRAGSSSSDEGASDFASPATLSFVDGSFGEGNAMPMNSLSSASSNATSRPFFPTGAPSIRPNAHSNRQKQLENLRRMEQRIRRLTSGPQGVTQGVGGGTARSGGSVDAGQPSPSSSLPGLASALGADLQAVPGNSREAASPQPPPPPPPTLAPQPMPPLPAQSIEVAALGGIGSGIGRSRMKVNTLDISEAVERHLVKWKSFESTALGTAPEETIFYSLVQGRGELILFGGLLGGSGMSPHGPSTGNVQQVTNNVWFMTSKFKMI